MKLNTITNHVRGAYRTAQAFDVSTAAKYSAYKVLRKATDPPVVNEKGLLNQKRLIENHFDRDEPAWLIWMDGGRYDYFEKLYPEYFDGQLTKVWNGGVGYTGDWSERHLKGDFSDYGMFTLAKLQSFNYVDYDMRDWFGTVPYIELEDNAPMKERLAALGYAEMQRESLPEMEPEKTNQAVLEHKDEVSGGVVRYLKPHPPFVGLEEMTAGASKTRDTMNALASGELTQQELCDAYEATYRAAFRYAADLIDQLDGRIVVTADHGECLTCGQLFHGRHHVMHDHLVEVPWLVIEP